MLPVPIVADVEKEVRLSRPRMWVREGDLTVIYGMILVLSCFLGRDSLFGMERMDHLRLKQT